MKPWSVPYCPFADAEGGAGSGRAMNMANFLRLHGLAALLALLASWPALADNGPASTAPVLTPKAVVSLEYPNPWDFNKLIAFSPDGRYLVDAADATRHIRVWDWREKTVAKRLLLNEEAPEFNDNKTHKSVLSTAGGEELTLSPDGRFMAACAGKGAMIWDLGSGQRPAYVGGILDAAPGIPEEARVWHGCDWLSFSPDSSRLAMGDGKHGMLFLTAQDWEAYQQANARASDRQMRGIKLTPEDFADLEKGKDKSFKGGVALYDTRDWRLVRFLRLRPWERLKSPALFTADGKQAIGLAYQYPAVFPKEVINTPASEQYITNRLVRWDIASGEIVASMELPKIFASGAEGVRWSWLPGGREVWWKNWPGQSMNRTEGPEGWKCEVPAPVFESDVMENCGYWWAVSVLDIKTGKRRFLVPVKKNIPRKLDEVKRFEYVHANISPDGKYLALARKMTWMPPHATGREFPLGSMDLSLFHFPSGELLAAYRRGEEENHRVAVDNLRFSGDSRWLTFRLNYKAFIFDLGINQ